MINDLESLPLGQLRDLKFLADLALRALEDEELAQDFEEARLPPGIENTKMSHFRTMNKISKDLEDKKITLDQYNRKSHDSISKNFRKAYRAGRGRSLDAGDEEWLGRAVNAEHKFARRFGDDIKNDRLRMPRAKRAAMYGGTIDSVGWNAKVEAQPDNVRIYWKLGKAEHCVDCIILASQSPFTKWNLPTTPRAGGTQCKSNCKCRLVFKRGGLSKAERQDAEEYGARKGMSLSEMLAPPKPPKGMRLATEDERGYVDDMWARINYNRRLIAKVGISKSRMKAAIVARKKANAELIEFLQKNDIYETPLWSVDEVINSSHIGVRAEADIFRYGIDGESLSLMSEREVGALITRYESEIGKKFKEYSKPMIEQEKQEKEALVTTYTGYGEYSIMTDSLVNILRIGAYALLAARGKPVQVGPFSDEIATRTYVWVKGQERHVTDTMEKLVRLLARKKIAYVATPVNIGRRRDVTD